MFTPIGFPILTQRITHDERVNPYNWTHREITYSADMCASSLDILERTCRVSLGERYPVAVVRLRAKILLGVLSTMAA
jgi:hypothetical protein